MSKNFKILKFEIFSKGLLQKHPLPPSLHNELSESGIRSGIDTRSERINAKVRDAQINKIPYMFIVGDREVESETVGVRLRSGEDLGALSLNEMKKRISSEVEGKIT